MATLTKAWGTGTGSVTLTYGGQLDGTITVDSDPNDLTVDRSMTIDVKSSVGGITRTVTIVQKGMTSPYDAKISYISTDGNQWIRIPLKGSESTDAIEIDFERTDNTNQQRYVCCESTSSVFNIYVNGSGKLGYRNNNGWRNPNSAVIGLTRHVIFVDYYNKVIKMDGTTLTWAGGNSTYTQNNNIAVLKLYSGNPAIVGKLYGLKFWRSGTLKYDMFPVRKNGVGYMYDSVSGTLFGNAGSGSFGLGPDL